MVWIRGDGEAARLAAEIVQLVDVGEATTTQTVTTKLLIAADQEQLPGTIPAVRVGPGGELLLPRDAALLAQIIVEACSEVEPTEQLSIVVAGCHGGAGTSTAARRLGRAGSAPVVDASGHPHSDPEVSLRWQTIDAADPPLIGMFSPADGQPLIRDAPGHSTGVESPLLNAVLARARGPIVIDGGVWRPAAETLPNPLIVMLCRASRSSTLLSVLESATVPPRLILSDRPGSPEIGWAAKVSGAQVRRPRRWKTMWRLIRA